MTEAPPVAPARRGSTRSVSGQILELVREFGLAALVGVVIAGAAWWSWQKLQELEALSIRRTVEGETRLLASQFSRTIAARSQEIERLAWHSQTHPAAETAWRAAADSILSQDLQFRALRWLGRDLEPRWTAPTTASTFQPADDEVRRVEIDRLGPLARPWVTQSLVLADTHRQLLFLAPIGDGERPIGTLVGAMRLRDLIDAVIKPELARGWSVSVYEGPFLVFGPVWGQSGPEAGWARDAAALSDGLSLRIQVWPSPELERSMHTFGPIVVLVLGYLLAVIAAAGLYVMGARTDGSGERAEKADAPAGEDGPDSAS